MGLRGVGGRFHTGESGMVLKCDCKLLGGFPLVCKATCMLLQPRQGWLEGQHSC